MNNKETSPITFLMIFAEWKSVYKSMESSYYVGFQALGIFPIEVVWNKGIDLSNTSKISRKLLVP